MDDGTLSIVMPYVSEMVERLITLGIFVAIFGLPSWAAVRIYRMRAGQRLRGEDEALLRGAMATLQGLEQRMATLEDILVGEAPGWRGDSQHGGQYGRQTG